MVARVTALEAKTRFEMLLERVAKGEEIVITRNDKPIARIIPAESRNLQDVRRAAAGLRALRRSIAKRQGSTPVLGDPEVRALIEEGRH